jgi:predicted dehydrogenase
MAMAQKQTRRRIVQSSMLAGAWLIAPGALARGRSPNERLGIACIGVGGRGAVNLEGVQSEEIVALCDVDGQRAGSAFDRFPKADKFADFRAMLDRLDRRIDAVVVSTPDHTHAVAAVTAMRMGKHVYCEKPLAHSLYECRTMAELAARNKLATQMGTQRHGWANQRRVVDLVRSGTIGPVEECHVWIGGSRGGGQRPRETPPVPADLKWDLWLGPAPERPYHPVYAPYGWRFWWDFGTGETGNMGCHILDVPFEALALGSPTTVEAEGPPAHPETTPKAMSVRYRFPARGNLPPLLLTWCHGRKPAALLPKEEQSRWGSGVLFVGREGMLLGDLFTWKLLPERRFPDLRAPRRARPVAAGFSWEPDSSDHYRQWIAACKTGSPTSCHFGYAGPLTEAVLLGNVAYRLGEKLHWDAKNLKAADCPRAEPFLRRPYRKGWTLG